MLSSSFSSAIESSPWVTTFPILIHLLNTGSVKDPASSLRKVIFPFLLLRKHFYQWVFQTISDRTMRIVCLFLNCNSYKTQYPIPLAFFLLHRQKFHTFTNKGFEFNVSLHLERISFVALAENFLYIVRNNTFVVCFPVALLHRFLLSSMEGKNCSIFIFYSIFKNYILELYSSSTITEKEKKL